VTVQPEEGENEHEAVFRLEHIEKVIERAKRERCQDCLPFIYLVPHQGVWIIVVKHDRSCPYYQSNEHPVRWENL
jgi:hypothetical protein